MIYAFTVSAAIILKQTEEADEETTILMLVDDLQLHEESCSFPEAEETIEVALEPFFDDVLGG